ncbi:villin-1-like [Orbicella faveolata]|uniref:villin-1-like n=1 Tax=Orbicella faveolata TaxID=48498 RepID=UPI0009E5FF47|nr:villin-1-like [Orbicella faveolata]
MPVAESGQRTFPGAGTKPGVEIWRIEFFKPVKVDPKQHGKFYKGDSYIILETRTVGKMANIYFWLGPETSQDEQGAAASLSVILDDEMGGYPVQHRVVGGYEDKGFRNLFPNISLLDGGHASGFKKGKKEFVKALIRVKGKRKVYASQVPLTVDSLNNGDCFVFDCGRKIFVWLGKESNANERFNAIKYGRGLRDEERAGLATVIVIGTPEEEEEFFLELTGNKRIVPITKEGESDEAHDEILTLNLYRVQEDSSGNITMKETGSKPLKQEDLDPDDAFILETGQGIYVWEGKKSTRNEKNQAFKDAQGFISARQLNPNTPIKVIKEELEPTEFKQYFSSWETTVPFGMTQTYHAGQGIATREKLDQRPKFEVKSMHDRRKSVTSSLPDDGTGTVQVYRVKGFKLEELPEKSHGVFYSGDCYVILYTYLKNGRERHIIYFWLGNDSTADEQGAAAAGAIALDDQHGGEPYQVRVCEGKEPEHFFMIFKRRLIIYQGGHASGFKNVKNEETGRDTRMLQVRVTGNNARIVEVLPVAQSLNSSDVFLIHSSSICYLWVGKGSIGDEREVAREAARLIWHSDDPERAMEGDERNAKTMDKIWTLLGGKGDYSSTKKNWGEGDNQTYPARLFHCSNASGRFRVEEVLDFSQEDLEEDDVMILDAWKELFVWVGESARKEEKHEAIRTALVMLLLISKELPGSRLAHLVKFSLNFSSSLFVIGVNLLHP